MSIPGILGAVRHTAEQVMTLKEARRQRGWTREQLFLRTGGNVSLSTIAAIERGGDYSPHASSRKALADALELSVEAIDWPQRTHGDGDDGQKEA